MKKKGNGRKLIPAEKREAFLVAFRAAFENSDWTPSAMAEKMFNADASWLTRILNGERGMDIYDLFRVCEILGVNPAKVVGAYPTEEKAKGRCIKVAQKLNEAIPDDLWDELKALRENSNK